ncbi:MULTISPECIES: aldehyde dehydrogenase family protein [Actinoalloteichus]|uniref:Aldehyde dehydrogenase (NAD+) n=2 Tax=Actinoalloteichus cyanogriseus TaxID=2893586 RepID=A0ABT1JND4_ACTCY|nr:aldehyde dehydrogenase family protein [Actinoalloteichus caeruleus]MCP2334042.1 aldehyde dehydrogenase (NAD+) [Actinoalloteichus caeruleus DSM 43889]
MPNPVPGQDNSVAGVSGGGCGTVTGESVTGPGARRFTSVDPRTGETVGHYPLRTPEEVEDTVASARAAGEWWSGLGFGGRAARLAAWRRHLVRHFDELAHLVCAETGKPVDDARVEVAMAVEHLSWAARHAERVLGRRRVPSGWLMNNQVSTVEYLPLGVVGVIGPWNFPVLTPMGSIAYALAAGNTVVFKPSELTPGVGRWLAASLAESVPERELLHTVTGAGDTGAALCASGVDKISFTGSASTGRAVLHACADSLTPVVLECGGKDALIVGEGADLGRAADAAVWGGLSNAGQICVSVERIYVVEAVAEEFLRLLVERVARVRPGGEPHADYGPMTDPAQVEVVRRQLAEALERGGRALVGGVESVRPPYVEPVVLVDVPEEALVSSEETFGPVLVVHRVPDLDTAVARANSGRHALGAAVFAGPAGADLAPRLRAGMVAVDGVLTFAAVPALPFGGSGESGFGRVHGEDGLRGFARAQSVVRRRFRPLLNPMTFTGRTRAVRRLGRLLRLRYRR